MVDQRRAKRFTIWFPMQIDASRGSDRIAESRNISTTGVLIATAARLEPGDGVTVTVQRSRDEPQEWSFGGKIVRIEPNQNNDAAMWPHLVAVEFNAPADQLQPMLVDIELAIAQATGVEPKQ